MTEVLFVRHCQSEMNLTPGLIGGRSNHTPPSVHGKHEARLLGQYFRAVGLQPDAAYSSGALRADTTANVSLRTAGLSLPIEIDEDLQELSQGSYEGKNRYDVYTPAFIAECRLDDIDGKFPDGESVQDVQERMWNFTRRACQRTPNGLVIAFSHGLAIRALTGRILDQTKREILETITDNVSLTKLTVQDGKAQVDYVGKNVITE